ncbi:hypothetical protein BJ138DRAFT_1154769 [Hygrophoropsis aurantiaca]|uniref:Uncharacterized protein n=1 Tax=Hygrophoropsis aurantiaca TaxID=72124 RepID=A0ACB8A990_9AGAM|nr:hypothetical protein BJ138DRAFT_1154769 [Hygrophoropsis aurantiaca]
MTIMGRDTLRTYFQPAIESITEEEIAKYSQSTLLDREQLIKKLIQFKVRYAIFSHRWFGTGEPTYQDMSKGKVPDGPGYKKLKEFCKKAKEFGCDFVWSDTCCIDKTSSAELDEAIRSMFRWYRGSHICIAYLADSSSIADFEKEAWFKRGWTLQELLAPVKLKFYGKGWVPLSRAENDKGNGRDNRIMDAISTFTRIPISDLISFQPRTDRVREKMSWASTRRTTKVEDVAYSLIGIFDVSLMVAYGEGRRAFFRLLETIVQQSNGLDIFQWKGEPSPHNIALPSSPRCYPYRGDRGFALRPDRTGDQFFALTNIGLRIKLLIIPVSCQRTSGIESGGLDLASIIARGPKSIFKHETLEDVVVLADVPNPRGYNGVNWALGIIDYWHTLSDEKGRVAAETGITPYTAFLLYNHQLDLRWKKVRVDEIIEVRATQDLEKNLEVVYLK